MKQITREGNLPNPVRYVLKSIQDTIVRFIKYEGEILMYEYPLDSRKFYEVAVDRNLSVSPLVTKDEFGRSYVVGMGLPSEALIDGENLTQSKRAEVELHYVEVTSRLIKKDYENLVDIQNARLNNPSDLNYMFQLERMIGRYEQFAR